MGAPIEYTVTLRSPQGGFEPTSFSEWIGHRVDITGLNPIYNHVLRSVQNASDGTWSMLTVMTYSDDGINLTPNLSVYPGTPKAQVRVHDVDGQHVVTAFLDAPLHEGAQVQVDNELHTIEAVKFPFRDPEDPEVEEDYQHVTARATPDAPAISSLGLPTAAMLAMIQ